MVASITAAAMSHGFTLGLHTDVSMVNVVARDIIGLLDKSAEVSDVK